MKKSTYNITHSSSLNKQTDETLFDRSKQRFYHAIKWNTIEAILYHTLYFVHQLALYALLAPHDYGQYGSLISFAFLCVPLLMGALDMALIPYMKQLSKDKQSFRRLIHHYLVPQCLLMLLMPLFLFVGVHYKIAAAINYLSSTECIFVGIFITLEAAKKLLRRILQLLFYNRYTAAVEVASISIYMSVFWGSHLVRN